MKTTLKDAALKKRLIDAKDFIKQYMSEFLNLSITIALQFYDSISYIYHIELDLLEIRVNIINILYL